MFATGSQVPGWLLIEVRGAWGVDAVHESALGEHVPRDWKDRLKKRGVRAVCIRSHLRDQDGEEGSGVRLYTCKARRPGGPPPELWTRTVSSLADVDEAAEHLLSGDARDDEWVRTTERVVLVCTNGRHDQCCANRGRPLVRHLRQSAWAGQVWECSHIGGDRFAANVAVLPESLYFGRVEPEIAGALLSGLDDDRLDLAHFRGRTSYTLTEQAVEHFVRTELGIVQLDAVVVERRDDDGAFPVRLPDRTVRVRVRRTMTNVADPLTCKGTPDQLVPTYTLLSID